jgi:hypothetical protein
MWSNNDRMSPPEKPSSRRPCSILSVRRAGARFVFGERLLAFWAQRPEKWRNVRFSGPWSLRTNHSRSLIYASWSFRCRHLLFILWRERYDDASEQRKISEIGPRGVMTWHTQRVWQLRSLESIPGEDRKIYDVPASQYLLGNWDYHRTLLYFRIRTYEESDLSTVTSQPSQSVTCVQIHRSGRVAVELQLTRKRDHSACSELNRVGGNTVKMRSEINKLKHG